MLQKMLDLLKAHPKKFELIRYILIGGLTTLISIVVFSLFCMAVSPYGTIDSATPNQALAGNILSWIVAVLFAFWGNRRIVFLRKGGSLSEIAKDLWQFVLSRLVSGLIFEILLFRLMTDVLGISNFLTKLVVLVLVTLFNYFISKFWIFAKKKG